MVLLKPIDHKEDIEKYEAFNEKKTLEFRNCQHTNTSLNEDRTELKCTCGASWTGPRLGELKLMFDTRAKKA